MKVISGQPAAAANSLRLIKGKVEIPQCMHHTVQHGQEQPSCEMKKAQKVPAKNICAKKKAPNPSNPASKCPG